MNMEEEAATKQDKRASIMDVYDMMGVTYTSSLLEVRKAFRNLALICHPDKGGNINDMMILKRSYDWICSQLETVELESNKGTFEEREAEFQAFLKAQSDIKLPTLNDINLDASGVSPEDIAAMKQIILDRFNELCISSAFQEVTLSKAIQAFCDDNNSTRTKTVYDYLDMELQMCYSNVTENIPASIPGGYGTIMDESIMNKDAEDDTSVLNKPPSTSFGEQELVIYETQQPCAIEVFGRHSVTLPTEMPLPSSLEDYSVGYSMCDYRAAYTETYGMSQKLEALYTDNGRLSIDEESYMKTRKELDMQLQNKTHERISLGLDRDVTVYL